MSSAAGTAQPVPDVPREASWPQRPQRPARGPVDGSIWRADRLSDAACAVVPTGHAALDAELPGGGWPCGVLSELLLAQEGCAELRLLAPAMQGVVAHGGQVVLVGPPQMPHAPGWQRLGIAARSLVWVRAETAAERLWTIEQLIGGDAAGLVLAWLPQARADQIRRLQVRAQACTAPVFLCRSEATLRESSAAPLRLGLDFGVDWELLVRIHKRKGPACENVLRLASVPAGLADYLTPRLRRPSVFIEARKTRKVASDAVGRVDSGLAVVRQLAA